LGGSPVAISDARTVLSRGQLKLAVIALQLAQLSVHGQTASTTPVLLIDDLAAELDEERLAEVVAALRAVRAQAVLTALRPDRFKALVTPGRAFHVEQGRVTEVI